MSKKKENPHLGSSFDDFLDEEGILEEATAAAVKRVLAWQIEQAMKERHLSKTAMAEMMHTSRSGLDNLLDPENESVTLITLQRAASVLGKRLHIDLVDFRPSL